MEKLKAYNYIKSQRITTIVIAAYCALVPLENVLEASSGGSINKYIGLVALMGVVANWIIDDERKIVFCKPFLFVVAFFGYALLSIVWMNVIPENNYYWMMLRMIVFTVVLLQYPLTNKELNFIYYSMIAVGIVLSILLLTRSQYSYVNSISGGRMTLVINGLTIDNNNLSIALALSIMCVIFFLMDSNGFVLKFFYYIILCSMLVAVLLTGSRGGMLAVFAGSMIIIMRKRGYRSLLKVIGVVILVLSIFIIAKEFLSVGLLERYTIKSVVESGGTGRIAIWKNIIKLFASSNVLREVIGYGYGTGVQTLGDYCNIYYAAHNDCLQVLLELGIVGEAVYLMMWYKTIRYTSKCEKVVASAMVALMFVAGLSMEVLVKKMFWLVIYFAYVPIQNEIEGENI